MFFFKFTRYYLERFTTHQKDIQNIFSANVCSLPVCSNINILILNERNKNAKIIITIENNESTSFKNEEHLNTLLLYNVFLLLVHLTHITDNL